jgi:hypothetical protein
MITAMTSMPDRCQCTSALTALATYREALHPSLLGVRALTRLGCPRAGWTLLGVAITLLVAAMMILATFPIDF